VCPVAVSAVPLTQWVIALASLSSALIALALAFGLKEWIFRPRVGLLLRHNTLPDEVSDRVVTKRIDTGDTTAFIRLRLDNKGRSTVRNVGVRVLQVHRWEADNQAWLRSRPELDGRLLQPSNQLPGEPDTVDVFPSSDGIVDLVSVGDGAGTNGKRPMLLEIGAAVAAGRRKRARAGNVVARALGVRRQHRRAALLHGRLVRRCPVRSGEP
jgi:hypothetical protein